LQESPSVSTTRIPARRSRKPLQNKMNVYSGTRYVIAQGDD
jgi:hypothetical protein